MKKSLILLTAIALIGGLLSTGAVQAQEAPTAIPETVQIDDPFGDANTQSGDQQFGEDIGSVGDIGKVWFTNDAETLTLNIQTETPGPASASNYRYNVYANPTPELTTTSACLRFEIVPINDANPGTYFGEQVVKVLDRCAQEEALDFYLPENGLTGELVIEELADGTGLLKATFPRTIPAFEDGAVISKPFAIDYIGGGTDQAARPDTGNTIGFTGLRVDDSVEGTDFTIAGGGPVVDPGDPPKVDPPVKKGCKKGKGKKKGCKKQKGCPTFTPAEGAAEAPNTVVTDAATEAAPIEIPIAAPAGTPDAPATIFQNLQVDTKSKDPLGLYVRYEFFDDEDMDVYLQNSDGSVAAQAAGFNPFPFIPNNPVFYTDGTGTGGHSEQGAEQVDGVLTPDCGGYSAQLDSFLSPGGDRVMKVWLGPATWDPVAQAPIEDEG